MFKVVTPKQFKQEIELVIPGLEAPAKVEIEFKYVRPADLTDYFKGFGTKPLVDGLSEVIISWTGFVDEADTPIPFSKEALQNLQEDFHSVPDQILQGWLVGLGAARLKNW